MRLPQRRSEKLKIWDNGPIYFTDDGLARLRAKLERLKCDLPSLISEAQRTAAYGDRSDNAEYKDAKGNLRRAQYQILSIEDQLKRVVVISSAPNTTGVVQLGSTVVLETDGARKTFQILGPRETDPAHARISHESPLGAALIGRVVGDIVTIQTTSGMKQYRIMEIQ